MFYFYCFSKLLLTVVSVPDHYLTALHTAPRHLQPHLSFHEACVSLNDKYSECYYVKLKYCGWVICFKCWNRTLPHIYWYSDRYVCYCYYNTTLFLSTPTVFQFSDTDGGCRVTDFCFRSSSKSEPPHKMEVRLCIFHYRIRKVIVQLSIEVEIKFQRVVKFSEFKNKMWVLPS